jgi:hypothetical protein
MKKEAIIDIIENDLNEIKTLLETFRGADKIPSAFLDLLSSKHASLGKELLLLNFWEDKTETVSFAEITQTKPKQAATPTKASHINAVRNTDLDFCADDYERKISPVSETAPKAEQPKEDPVVVSSNISLTPVVEMTAKTIKEEASTVATEDAKRQTITTEPSIETPKVTETPKPTISHKPENSAPSVADITNYGLPVDDIRKAISIADRFLFQRELFNNNNETMNNTLDTINNMTTYEEAYNFIKCSFSWNEEDPTTENFLKTMHRRFLIK